MTRRPARSALFAALLAAALLTTIPSNAADTGLGWAAGFGGTGAGAAGETVDVDADGNVITGGYFTGSVDFEPDPDAVRVITANVIDAFISKLGPAGGYHWTRRIGETGRESATSVGVDGSGTVYATGYYT